MDDFGVPPFLETSKNNSFDHGTYGEWGGSPQLGYNERCTKDLRRITHIMYRYNTHNVQIHVFYSLKVLSKAFSAILSCNPKKNKKNMTFPWNHRKWLGCLFTLRPQRYARYATRLQESSWSRIRNCAGLSVDKWAEANNGYGSGYIQPGRLVWIYVLALYMCF